MENVINDAGAGPEHIVPFYSGRTLERIQSLVKDLSGGLAVYISKDHRFATIGTRGVRPLDGVSGLIIHLSLNLADESERDPSRRIILDNPVHNLRYTKASRAELKDLLIGTLEASGFLPPGSRSADIDWDTY
jgi:hypothetical protein